MRTVLKTAPGTLPVLLAEVKRYINRSDSSWDDKLNDLIAMAKEYVEDYTGRALITQTWTAYLDTWSSSDTRWYFDGGFHLPKGQLQSVTHVKYTDADEDQTTWSTDDYDVDIKSDPGLIRLAYEKSFPSDTLYPTNPIEIEYVCGYGDADTDIPYKIKLAMMSLIADWVNLPGELIIGTVKSQVSKVDRYLDSFRLPAVMI